MFTIHVFFVFEAGKMSVKKALPQCEKAFLLIRLPIIQHPDLYIGKLLILLLQK